MNTRRMLVGTGWKMNINATQTREYAAKLNQLLSKQSIGEIDIFVLPPFTSLHAARTAFSNSPVAYGGQNMHWDSSGAWTGEISASMLVDEKCSYVELAHSERLTHFNEDYSAVRLKINSALSAGLIPILCIGELAEDKDAGRADEILIQQASEALADVSKEQVSRVVFGYEPRWAIGASNAAPVEYVAARHSAFRKFLSNRFCDEVGASTRIIYGGSVTAANAAQLAQLPDVDGLFVGRAAWTPEGFSEIVNIVAKINSLKKH